MRKPTLVPAPGTLLELSGILRDEGFLSTQRIPSLKRPFWKIVAEPQVLSDYKKGRTNCFSSSALPGSYIRSFFRGRPRLELLYRLFFLNHAVPSEAAYGALNRSVVQNLLNDGIVWENAGSVLSNFRVVPWRNSLLLSDPDEDDDERRENYVYVGGDSTILSDFVSRTIGGRKFRRGLDLCAGTSIQAHSIVDHCQTVDAAEYNPRAVAFAGVNAAINGLEGKVRPIESNLWEKVDGVFDIVVCNPPYVPMPDHKVSKSNMDAYGGADYGMNIPVEVFRGLSEHLDTSGYAVFLASSPVVGGRSLLHERLAPLASDLGLSATLTAWNYTDLIHDREYQRHEGISHFVFFFVEVTRSGSGGLKTVHLPFLRKYPLLLNALLRRHL
ncbi:MAG: class I SAM-dependent methyltransferase [Candidatus Fermentibacteraceae bacterium]